MPRVLNVLLGVWLLVSPFLLRHLSSEGFNDETSGLFVLMFALIAIWAPAMRWGSTFVGAYLLVTAITFPHGSLASALSQILAGGAITLLSFVPSRPRLVDARRPAV